MDERRKSVGLGVVAGAGGLVVLLAAVWLVVVYSGAYNIAATEEHTSLTRWTFDTTFKNSIERGAADVAGPESLTPAMAEAGAESYKETCQHCHAGPGVERAAWANGMRPQPPHLTEAAPEWEPTEIFWLVKHGAKMTGMPAFGPSHDDETLWNIVAFVKELPAMTPERYAALGGGESAQGAGTH